MPIPHAYKDLVRTLLVAGKQDAADWSEDPRRPGAFSLRLRMGKALLTKYSDDYGTTSITVAVLDSRDRTRDDFTVNDNEPEFRDFDNLYSAALWKARDVEGLLSDLNCELSELLDDEEESSSRHS